MKFGLVANWTLRISYQNMTVSFERESSGDVLQIDLDRFRIAFPGLCPSLVANRLAARTEQREFLVFWKEAFHAPLLRNLVTVLIQLVVQHCRRFILISTRGQFDFYRLNLSTAIGPDFRKSWGDAKRSFASRELFCHFFNAKLRFALFAFFSSFASLRFGSKFLCFETNSDK